MGKIIDIFFEGINFTKLMIIVSNKSEEIAKQIDQKVSLRFNRFIWKRTCMAKRKSRIDTNVCKHIGDVAGIKIITKEIDPKSFIVITNLREVVEQGFKN